VCSGPSAGVRPTAVAVGPDTLWPDALCPEVLCPGVRPEVDALLPSADPPRWSGAGCFRGDVGFTGWLGTR